MVPWHPSCRPGSRGRHPARKFGQPSCRARQPRCRARLPGRHLRCRGPGAAAAEMRWRFTSRAYLEVSRSDLLVKGSSSWGAVAAAGLPRPRHPGCRGGTRAAAAGHPSCRTAAPEVPPRHLQGVSVRSSRTLPKRFGCRCHGCRCVLFWQGSTTDHECRSGAARSPEARRPVTAPI